MYKTRIAIFQQRDRQIIVIPLDCSFEDRPLSQRCEALANIQKAALKAGLDAPAAAVWRVGNKLRFMAPTECPVGHFKLPHFWPVKFPQAGQSDYQSSVLLRARRAAASLSR